MTPTRRAPTHPGAPVVPVAPARTLLVLVAVAVLVAVGCLTLGPPGPVADGRRAVLAAVGALGAPWLGTVHRAQVEAVANVLLFVPVGALANLALPRRGPVLPVFLGAGTSMLVELAQTAVPGRVPDLADVAANTVGTVLGVALTAVLRVLSRRAAVRRRAVRPRRPGARAALVAVALVLAVATGCSSAGRVPGPAGSAGAAPTTRGGGHDLTAEDGWLPDGEVLSPFDEAPALTRLDSTLRTAVQDASRAASADGITLSVTSGWRSAAYQQALFDDAVGEYSSAEAARTWVLGPEESAHVRGAAVDVGPTDAMYWLSWHGSDYGLCQTYANEVWHYELTVERGGECPPPAASPAGR